MTSTRESGQQAGGRTVGSPPVFGRLLASWVRWLRHETMPVDHISIVLGLDQAELEAWLRWPGRRLPSVNVPTGPPRPKLRIGDLAPGIRGRTATKILHMHHLGYPPQRISTVLAISFTDVKDYLRRTRPVRRETVTRPRSAAEQAALEANRRRRYNRQYARCRRKAAAPAVPASWRSSWSRRPAARDADLDRVAASVPAIVPAAAELPDLVAVQDPPAETAPVRNPWQGSASMRAVGVDHGSAKLSEGDVRTILQLYAGGMSIYALARKYTVADGTIGAIVRRVTWKHLQDVPSPLPG